jgi:RNA polymerase sigma-70 factor (ECF subfamily)
VDTSSPAETAVPATAVGQAGPPEPDLAESELAARVRSGDGAAFEALFRRYYRRLHAFAETYVGSSEVAEDLTVDVFVRIWERRAEWSLRGGPKSYLYAAVRNEALAWLRRRKMVERAHADLVRDERRPGMGGPPAAADAQVQAHELADAVERATARLPERTREAFVLHRRHGLSYAEVAQTMGISPRTVEVLIRRAFQALRTQLGGFLVLLLTLFSALL